MRPLLFAHDSMADHRPGFGHPERPERLRAVLRGFEGLGFAPRRPSPANREALLRVHTLEHLACLEAAAVMAQDEPIALDADTRLSAGSLPAALLAAGAVVEATQAVLQDGAPAAFCAVRPPGHHAEPERAMGFCLLNSIAVGALHALAELRCARVAVLDIDVHHGNGTQAVAEHEPRLFFASVHQSPLYPGTGGADERGRHNNITNAPLPPGTEGPAWRLAVLGLLRQVQEFGPELLLVSAGFDGHAADPLSHFELQDEDFAWAGRTVSAFAGNHCRAGVVATLEGGYDLRALESAAAAFAGGLGAPDFLQPGGTGT